MENITLPMDIAGRKVDKEWADTVIDTIGRLRAIGAMRRQIRSMVLLEALIIAVYGAIVGLVLGVWFAVALQRTLVDQGIEVLDVPSVGLATFLLIAAIVGVLAALWPAFRAGRLNVLQAISTE